MPALVLVPEEVDGREGSGRSQVLDWTCEGSRGRGRERGGMSVSGEGAALRSARTWLLLLCPEIPGRSGGKGEELVAVSRKAAGCLGGSQRRHGMAHGAAGKKHGVAGAYTRRNTQGRVEGAFSYPNWRLFCTGSCSAGSTRPDAGLRTPSIAAFGRSRPSAAVDRGSRPSAAAADRRIEIGVATADPCRLDIEQRHLFLLLTTLKYVPHMTQLAQMPSAYFVNVPDGSLKYAGT